MISTRLLLQRIGACMLGLFIFGCQDSRTVPSSTELAATPELPSEAPGAEPVSALGKPIPPIDISYEMLGEPQVGQPLEIRVITRSQVVLTEVSVDVQGDERILVTPATRGRNVARVPRDEAMVRTVTVTPFVEGALHISVLVRAEINGKPQARNVSIPIRVGSVSVPAASAGELRVDESGEPIISLPAQEFP